MPLIFPLLTTIMQTPRYPLSSYAENISISFAKVVTDCSSLKRVSLFRRSLISAAFSKANYETDTSISFFNLSIV